MSYIPRELNATGLFLEFGVRDAGTICHLAKRTRNITWHGFDSFQGLPTTATASDRWKAGLYSRDSAVPTISDDIRNVRLHKGWFNESLKPFLKRHPGQPVAFMHCDADIYESTREVLYTIFSQGRQRVGTVIAFDELFGTRLQTEHEYRALQETVRFFNISYRFISYALTPGSPFARAAVQIVQP